MKLCRFVDPNNRTIPSITDGQQKFYNASSFNEDWDAIFFATDGLQRLHHWLSKQAHLPELDTSQLTFAPAIGRPPNIHCVGLNYAAHVREFERESFANELPSEPVLFNKATSSWAAPNSPLIIPWDSEHTDWEVELAIVIGKRAKYVNEENAVNYIAGYSLINDYSERHWQKKRLGQWMKGKSAESFAPFGPFMATPDEIPDPHQLRIWLKLNGTLMQDGNTNQFLFNIPYLISYISQFTVLLPGDVICTGTPAGVGLGQHPPRFLRHGDKLEYGIDGLGSQTQLAVKEPNTKG